ncbi:unnamed protein product [Symbiodinium microadriaticum]|nr:unnamed protein product [Symbiodinium microadriaticum]
MFSLAHFFPIALRHIRRVCADEGWGHATGGSFIGRQDQVLPLGSADALAILVEFDFSPTFRISPQSLSLCFASFDSESTWVKVKLRPIDHGVADRGQAEADTGVSELFDAAWNRGMPSCLTLAATEVTVSNTSGRFHQGRMSVSPAVEELTGWWTLTSPSVQELAPLVEIMACRPPEPALGFLARRAFKGLREAYLSGASDKGPPGDLVDLLSATVTLRQLCLSLNLIGMMWMLELPSQAGLRFLAGGDGDAYHRRYHHQIPSIATADFAEILAAEISEGKVQASVRVRPDEAHILMKPEALCSGKPHAALKVYLVGTPVVRRAGDRRELGHI